MAAVFWWDKRRDVSAAANGDPAAAIGGLKGKLGGDLVAVFEVGRDVDT